MSKASLCVIFFFAIGASSTAVGQRVDTKHDPCTRGDYDRALAFLHGLQVALRTNRPADVVEFIHYPLRVPIHGKNMIQNRSEFLRDYNLIFTAPRRNAIVATEDAELWCRDQGYSISYGMIWFDSFMPKGQSFPDPNSPQFWKSGTFGLTTVNFAPTEKD
jgi:hypothetical protein